MQREKGEREKQREIERETKRGGDIFRYHFRCGTLPEDVNFDVDETSHRSYFKFHIPLSIYLLTTQ